MVAYELTDRSCRTPETQTKDFRIDVQLAGDHTLLFSRWEAETTTTTSDWVVYGNSFERHVTKPARGCEAGTGHHRIISYVRTFLCFLPVVRMANHIPIRYRTTAD